MDDRMTAQKLKNSILQMAVQGKLVPQDPNDEPASVLLERIRREKEQLIKEGKIKRNKNESYIFRGADNLHYEQIGKEIKCIEDELPFEIPDSWEWTRLNEIRIKEIKRGKSPKYTTKSDILVFAQKCNTKYKGIDISLSKFLDPSVFEGYDDGEKIVDGDIIINSTGTGTMGRIGYYSANYNPNNYVLVPDSHVTIVRVSTFLISKFIKYTVDQYHDYFEKHGEGSTNQKELRPITIQNILIPIPPQSEQIKIIKTIDKLELLIEKYKQIEEQLYELNSNIKEQLKKSILQYAIEGKLVPQDPNDEPASALLERIHEEKQKLIAEGKIKKDKNESIIYRRDNSYYEKLGKTEIFIDDKIPFEIPNSWCWVRLKNIVNVVSARRVHKSDWRTEGIPFYRAREIGKLADNSFVENELFIDKELYDKFSLNGIPKAGDLMITAVGTLGKTYIVQPYDRFYYKDASVICFENYSKIIPEYLKLVMETRFMNEQIKNSSSGTTVGTITIIKANDYLIPIPPVLEQKRIIDRLNILSQQIETL